MRVPTMLRTRWAAIGAAVAVSLGAGGFGLARATSPAGASAFVAITPCRVMDTRAASQVGPRSMPLGPNDVHSVSGVGATGDCQIPETATGLALNVTAVEATEVTYLTIFPAGVERPKASSLNPAPGQPATPNAVTTDLGAGGQFSIFNLQGNVHVIADVVGYYTDHHHDDRYYTRGQVDSVLSGKADAGAGYTKAESDARYVRVPSGSVDVALADFGIESANDDRWSYGLLWSHTGYQGLGSRQCLQANPDLPSGADVTTVELHYIRHLPAATTTTTPGQGSPEAVSVLIGQIAPTAGPISQQTVLRPNFANTTVLAETGAGQGAKVSLPHDPAILANMGLPKRPVNPTASNQFIQLCASSAIDLLGVTVHFDLP